MLPSFLKTLNMGVVLEALSFCDFKDARGNDDDDDDARRRANARFDDDE